MRAVDKKIQILAKALGNLKLEDPRQSIIKLSAVADINRLLSRVKDLALMNPKDLDVEIKSLNRILKDLGFKNIEDGTSWGSQNNIALDQVFKEMGVNPEMTSYRDIKKKLSDFLNQKLYSTESGLEGKIINLSPERVLFFRSAPNPDSEKIAALKPGQKFIYLGDSEEYLGYNYIKVSIDNREGWISSNYAEYYNLDGSVKFSGKPPPKRIFQAPSEEVEKEKKVEKEQTIFHPSSGLIMPIQGTKVSSEYGMRDDPMNKGHQKMHSGVDLSAKTGTPVLAPEAGIITRVAPNNGGAGNMLVMSGSKGRVWTFMHLSSFDVQKNNNVSQGQIIAHSGATGDVTGPHLHLELRINGSKVDPMTVLSGASSEVIKPTVTKSVGDVQGDWLKSVSELSNKTSERYGVPKSIILAQGALESNFGRSDLGGFNFFGIKGVGSSGSVEVKTKEEFSPGSISTQTDTFKAFKGVEDAFDSYGSMLRSSPRYSLATQKYWNQPGKFAIYIWGKGYATDSSYPQKLSNISKTIASKLSSPPLSFSFSPEEEAMIAELASLSGDSRARRTEELLGSASKNS